MSNIKFKEEKRVYTYINGIVYYYSFNVRTSINNENGLVPFCPLHSEY